MQARTLEEIELQQPFFERTVRPLARPPVRRRPPLHQRRRRSAGRRSGSPMAGNPGDLRTIDFLGLKVVVAGVVAGVLVLVFGLVVGDLAVRPAGRRRAVGVIGFFAPGLLAQPAHQEAPQGDPAGDPGHAGPADDLGEGRPRLRRRAGQGRREDERPARR